MKNIKKSKLIFFGTGLSSTKEASVGLGLDVLSMIFASAIEGKRHGCLDILHELGTDGYVVTEEQKKRLVAEQMGLFNTISERLAKMKLASGGTINLTHITSDANIGTPEYNAALEEVHRRLKDFDPMPNFQKYKKYTAIQSAEVKLAADKGAFLKEGWTPNGKGVEHLRKKLGNTDLGGENLTQSEIEFLIANNRISELYFDQIYNYCFPESPLKYKYIAGDIDRQTGLRRSPYTVTASDVRPLLNERFGTFAARTSGLKGHKTGMKETEKRIVAPFEELFGEIQSTKQNKQDQIIEKVETIQDRIIGL